jgi:hypothetical protein
MIHFAPSEAKGKVSGGYKRSRRTTLRRCLRSDLHKSFASVIFYAKTMPQAWSSSPLSPGASPQKGGWPLQVIMLYDDRFPSPSIQRLTNINLPSTGMRGLNIATFIPRENKRTKRKPNEDSLQVRWRPPYRAIWRHCESGPWHWKASSAAGQEAAREKPGLRTRDEEVLECQELYWQWAKRAVCVTW